MAFLGPPIPDDVWFGPIAADTPPPPPTDPTEPVGERPHEFERGLGLVIRLDFIPGLTDQKLSSLFPFTFQAPPINSFPINRSYPATKYDTISGQQFSRPGVTQLESYAWQTIFTDTKFSWTLLHGAAFVPSPLLMLERLDAVGRSKRPIHLSARNPLYSSLYDVNTPAMLESVNSEEHEGEIDARYVSVEFSEYRDTVLDTKRRGGGPRGGGSAPSSAAGHKPSTIHTDAWFEPTQVGTPAQLQADSLNPGVDNLYKLATFYYGAPEEWRRIAQANGIDISPSTPLSTLGARTLSIPAR